MSSGKQRKKPRVETLRTLFVAFSKWFSLAYLLIYVGIPFFSAVLPHDMWGEVHLIAFRQIVGVLYHYTAAVPWFKEAMTAIFPVTLLILSLHYGGLLTEFYERITQFGILNARDDRKGQDAVRTPEWIDRISRSKEVVIVGTVSKGWFVTAFDDLEQFLQENENSIDSFDIYLLDPFGETWRSRIQYGLETYQKFWRDVWQIVDNLEKVLRHRCVNLYFYDSEPLSCVVARGLIYLGLYLPRTDRKEVPELTISVSSYLGDKIYNESIKKLRHSAPPITPKELSHYTKIMSDHIESSADKFWDDSRVHCDFCKEAMNLPTAFSRRFPNFPERVVHSTTSFRLMPTIRPLTSEHALFVSNQHVTSSAQLGAQALREAANFQDLWAEKMRKQSKTPFVFEHGVPFESTSYGGCGICHCHIHLLSTGIDPADLPARLDTFLRTKGYSPRRHDLKSWADLEDFRNDPYIAVRVGSTEAAYVFVFEHAEHVESQLMRQFAANAEGATQNEWDWRSPLDEDALKKEQEALRKAMEQLKTFVA